MKLGLTLITCSHGPFSLYLIIIFVIRLDTFLEITKQLFLLIWIN